MADQVTTGRFVGRTQQLARLRQLLARAVDGQPLLAVIGGEAGSASVHVSNILAKLGVAGRVEAAAIAHRLGLD
jgi:hypothetical protein